jgi:hypothetical protein
MVLSTEERIILIGDKFILCTFFILRRKYEERAIDNGITLWLDDSPR